MGWFFPSPQHHFTSSLSSISTAASSPDHLEKVVDLGVNYRPSQVIVVVVWWWCWPLIGNKFVQSGHKIEIYMNGGRESEREKEGERGVGNDRT